MTDYTGKLAVSLLRRILVLAAIFASWTYSNYDQHGTFVVTGVAAATAATVVIADTLARLAMARAWRRIKQRAQPPRLMTVRSAAVRQLALAAADSSA